MTEYTENCKISGIGNAATRYNEITADDLATLRYFQTGWDCGVIDKEGYNFSIQYALKTSSVEVGKGIMFAYGYFGYVDNCKLEFIRPAIPQYHIIYVELDRSKIPNTCILKVKNNQSSTNIERTFRQDYLDKVRTGVFQLPLWRIKVGSNGIETVVDLRALRDKIGQVGYTPNCESVFGEISQNATASTQPADDVSDKIATTLLVCKKARLMIDGEVPDVLIGTAEITAADVEVKGERRFYVNTNAALFTNSTEIKYNGAVASASPLFSLRAPIIPTSYIVVECTTGDEFGKLANGTKITVEVYE